MNSSEKRIPLPHKPPPSWERPLYTKLIEHSLKISKQRFKD